MDAEGQITDFPSETVTYNLRVVRNGSEETRQITVFVDPVAGLPQIEYFDVSPEQGVTVGQCVTLAWRVSDDAEFVSIFSNKDVLWDVAPHEGTLEDCPQSAGLVEYAVGVRNSVGANYAVDFLVIGEASESAAQAMVAPAGPTIASFAVTPDEITVNECVAIDWTVVGNLANLRILRNDVVLLDGGADTGSGSDCLLEAGAYTYRLEATDNAGLTSSAETKVTASTATVAADTISGSYVLATYRNAAGEQVSPIAETQVTAEFSSGTLSGNGGCNVYSGSYTAVDGAISVSPLASTMMFCVEPEGIGEQEAAYLAALQGAALYALDGSQLTLSDVDGAPLVVYVAQ